MSHQLPSPLPQFDRNLLRAAERIVPTAEREEWLRTWQAELWHMHHRTRNRPARGYDVTADLCLGVVRDALWLRADSWRCAFSGTAILCLVSLLGFLMLSTLVALGFCGSWQSLGLNFGHQFNRFLFEAPLVVFVGFATASRRHIDRSTTSRKIFWIRRQVFFVAKISLILLFAFFLSADICQPVHAAFPNVTDLVQTFSFIIFALLGLRWAFADQEQRCKQCLRSLATPARVGRPSHNLLEWNGTELLCKRGHGLLNVPEMETSWCESSQWVDQSSRWTQTVSI